MAEHSYGLDWIDEDKLFEVTQSTFKQIIKRSRRPPKDFKNPPDPFTLAAQAVLTETSLENTIKFEPQRALNKSLSNAIGIWHQHVLGLAPNWTDTGAAGGVIDLKTKDNTDNPSAKRIVAEVKNRFNTIKASDEKETWDKLDTVARSNNAIGYLFQIVPKNQERYDKPWNVSGRPEKEFIRVCDGATAYEMVFEHKDALKELYLAFPILLSEVAVRINLVTDKEALHLYSISMPLE